MLGSWLLTALANANALQVIAENMNLLVTLKSEFFVPETLIMVMLLVEVLANFRVIYTSMHMRRLLMIFMRFLMHQCHIEMNDSNW